MKINKVYRRSLFKQNCTLCDQTLPAIPQLPFVDLCEVCQQALPRNLNACRRCALPLKAQSELELCGQCLSGQSSADRAWSPFLYELPFPALISDWKYRANRGQGRILSRLFLQALALEAWPMPELLIPVPLHPTRLRERGFNQSQWLARRISKATGIPVATQLIERSRVTLPQQGQSAKARRANLRHAFRLTRTPDVAHIAIIDDVMTTGATAESLIRILRRAGVQQIDLWTLARTPLPSEH
ncbi:ComF family protein [Pokkaliibacter sp. CJK22405]|uniref:ComF family protein n=1 Tax=Pokkaliibacter sp. CJK22405 TaxID=3384615 RepID=UPI0039854F10